MKQEGCVVLPTASAVKPTLTFVNGGADSDKFLNISSWNGAAPARNPESSCRSVGSLSSSLTNPVGVESGVPSTCHHPTVPVVGGAALHLSANPATYIAAGGSGRSNGGSSAASSPQLGHDLAAGGSGSPISSSNQQQQQQTVFVHVNPGETLSVRVGNDVQHIPGPATVRMVSSHNSPPPMPLPLQVPPGHIVQQIIDESGVLRHVILSPQSPPIASTQAAPPFPNVANGALGSFLPVQNGHHHHLPHLNHHQHHHDGMVSPAPPGCQPSPSTTFYPTANHLPIVTTDPHHICQLHISQDDPSLYGVAASRNLRMGRFDKRRRDIYSDFRSPNDDLIDPQSASAADAVPLPVSAFQDVDNRSATTSGTEEDELAKIADMLSGILPPRVCEVGPRAALVTWTPFDCSEASASGGPFPQIDASEFTYQVLLYEKRPDAVPKYNHRCQSDITQQSLSDLKPSTEYFVRLRALLEERGLSGEPSPPVSFKTKCTEPDKPLAPRLNQRLKTALLFRWTAPCENGSRIVAYHLDLMRDPAQPPADGLYKDEWFDEVYCGPNKQTKVTHLLPSTLYRVRLAASNQFGKSVYSDPILVQTAGAAPPPPDPPRLAQAKAHSLLLEWNRRDGDDEFRLAMEDPTSGHGFLPVCVTGDTSFLAQNLHSLQDYHFRLCAANEDGASAPSDSVTYRTAPGEPQPPLKLLAKTLSSSSGAPAAARSVRVTWQPPRETGGGDVLRYFLQFAPLSVGAAGESLASSSSQQLHWTDVYVGLEREYLLHNLSPGQNYVFRIACEAIGGRSQFSEVTSVSTSCVCPGACQPPKTSGKVRPSSLTLKWAAPEFSGGSDIVEYEVAMGTDDVPINPQAPCIVYKGPKTECSIGALSPGAEYTFKVRSRNKTGLGPWSSPVLLARTGAASPDVPVDLSCTCSSHSTVLLRWHAPEKCNGAPVTEYRLQQAMRKCVSLRVPDMHAVSNPETTSLDGSLAANVADSPVVTRRAMSAAATSSPISSAASSVSTTSSSNFNLPSSSAPTGGCHSSSMDSAATGCTAPPSPELDFGPFVQVYAGSQTAFEARELRPASDYAFRVQAINVAGVSKFSSLSIVRTPAGPPDPPVNVCAETFACDQINVSWDPSCDNGSPLIGYILEVQPAPATLELPVQLPAHCTQYLLESLTPDTVYKIRLQALNEVDVGPLCSPIRCTTYSLPPLPPTLELATTSPTSLKLRWSDAITPSSPSTSSPPSAAADLSYVVEVETRSGGFSRVYEGAGRSCKVLRLLEHTAYRFRIRAIAVLAGQGPWSPLRTFKTSLSPPPAVKDQFKVSDLSTGPSFPSYQIEWQPVKMQLNSGEKLLYTVQLCSSLRPSTLQVSASGSPNVEEIKNVYKGSATSCIVQSLPDGFWQYKVRVVAVRCTPGVLEEATDESGASTTTWIETAAAPTSPLLLRQASVSNSNDLSDSCHLGDAARGLASQPAGLEKGGGGGWTDRQWAVLILVGFSAITVFVAILLQQLVV